jgi:NAD(P)-dependent dehydrogenase (short-subunit alcohol dehydrogenase family)
MYGQNLRAGYGAAKMAVMGLVRVLSVEGKRYHISTNVVAHQLIGRARAAV